jgi:hypothetical protein
MKTLLTIFMAIIYLPVIAQPDRKSVVIGSMTSRPNAVLIVNPEHSDQGVLLPQLTSAQRAAMSPSSPLEDGLMVFDITEKSYFFWSQGAWVKLRRDESSVSKYYSIDPLQFQELKPDNSIRHNNLIVFESDNTFVTASPNGAGEEVIAPVTLPHKAVMQELTVYYMDNDDKNLRILLMRKSMTGTNEEILRWESSGASPVVASQTFTSFSAREVVDMQNFTYRVVVVFDVDESDTVAEPAQASQRIYGVRIKYAQ